MLRIFMIAIVVVVAVLIMSGIMTVDIHEGKVAEVTESINKMISNQKSLSEATRIVNDLKTKGEQFFAKTDNDNTNQENATPTAEVAGARDEVKTTPTPQKSPQIEVKTTIPLLF